MFVTVVFLYACHCAHRLYANYSVWWNGEKATHMFVVTISSAMVENYAVWMVHVLYM